MSTPAQWRFCCRLGDHLRFLLGCLPVYQIGKPPTFVILQGRLGALGSHHISGFQRVLLTSGLCLQLSTGRRGCGPRPWRTVPSGSSPLSAVSVTSPRTGRAPLRCRALWDAWLFNVIVNTFSNFTFFVLLIYNTKLIFIRHLCVQQFH